MNLSPFELKTGFGTELVREKLGTGTEVIMLNKLTVQPDEYQDYKIENLQILETISSKIS